MANYVDTTNVNYPPVEGKSYHGRGLVQLSWNYNYGAMSEPLFGDKSISLENPNLVARDGIINFASAIWFWMQPQGNKPSAHDVMVGNVGLSKPYTPPTSRARRTSKTHTATSKGCMADGTVISHENYTVPAGFEVGFGTTINIINGGLESNTGTIDNRQARRITLFARYLDYFGINKDGRDDRQNLSISPQVSGGGGDPVPSETITAFQDWHKWIYMPDDGKDPNGEKDFPKDKIPSIISSVWASSF